MLIDSVSIHISLMGASWADLIVDALRQRLLAHGDARAPLCMHSMGDGRRQLGPLLSLAQAELHALTPALLLPEGLGLPRSVRMRLQPSSAIGPSDKRIKRGTRFARSPLAVLIRLPETAPGASDDDDEQDDEDEDEEEEEEEEEEEDDDEEEEKEEDEEDKDEEEGADEEQEGNEG